MVFFKDNTYEKENLNVSFKIFKVNFDINSFVEIGGHYNLNNGEKNISIKVELKNKNNMKFYIQSCLFIFSITY